MSLWAQQEEIYPLRSGGIGEDYAVVDGRHLLWRRSTTASDSSNMGLAAAQLWVGAWTGESGTRGRQLKGLF